MYRKLAKIMAVPAVVAGVLGGVQLAASAAQASVPLVTASTHITNNDDDGGNGYWSVDDFTRTLTVSADPALAGVPTGDTGYSATIADSGTWNGIVGAFTPNQGASPVTGEQITHSVSGQFAGSSSYEFYAPTADVPSAANVAATLDDNFTKPTSGPDSTSSWYLQAFPAADQASVAGPGIQNDWTWTYKDKAESWTDSFADGDGQSTPVSLDGNITGAVPVKPSTVILSDGKSKAVTPTREDYSWVQNTPTWDKLTITGPGFNHQVGWVSPSNVNGLKTGYYSGLKSGHTYVVELQPTNGKYGTDLPSTAGNRVTFVTEK